MTSFFRSWRAPLLAGLVCAVLSGGEGRRVRVAVFPHAPAISMGTDGCAQGFFADILQDVATREGWQLEYVAGSWSEGLDRLREGKVDLATSVARTADREAFLSFGQESSYTVWSLLYAHPEAQINTILDLKGLEVGIMAQDVNGQRFQELCQQFRIPCTFREYPTFPAVLGAVARNECQAGVTSSVFGYAQEHGFAVHRTPVVVNPFDLYFATHRGRNQELLQALDAYLREGRKGEGTAYHRALERWLHPPERARQIPAWIWKVGMGGLGLLAVALGLVVLFRRKVAEATQEIRALNGALAAELAARHEEEAQRIQLEKQVLHAQKLESLGLLAGGIAHDFNNLLSAMLGHLNVAQMKAGEGSVVQPHLSSLEKIIHRTADLTRQMLAYSGRGRFVVQAYDLNQVVTEMMHLLEVSISKRIRLERALAPGLPSVDADGAQLQQVILNLVTNASDAIAEAEGTIRIVTGVHCLDAAAIARCHQVKDLAPGRYVVLEVSDTGCGMSPEVQARIFDPFFTTKRTGRGLGLSATLGILRGHGAGLCIESTLGEGTTFRVLFPVGKGAPAVRTPMEKGGQSCHGLRVLLVDDEAMVRRSALEGLQQLGCVVTEARDGAEALERLQEAPHGYDLVLMDLTMPRMDGRQAFLAMRVLRPDLRVILSSGYSEQESIHGLMEQGLGGFLPKPYTLKALRDMLAAPSHVQI